MVISWERTAERLAWSGGLLAIGIWGMLHLLGDFGARRELGRFAAARAPLADASGRSLAVALASYPDQQLWSPIRVRAWQEARARQAPAAIAVLRIRRLGLEVPVLEGTDEWTLNRGAGHIEDTAQPGAVGNIGIAAHRDGFFRVLKDVVTGDTLEIETPQRTMSYRVERQWIVAPEDASVLDPTASPAVTLVTCYPFYFIGAAPQRFIVRAVRTAPETRP